MARSSSEPSFSASLASISAILSANCARSSSCIDVATSASTVRPLSDTSARPPSTMIFCCVPPDITVRIPGRIAVTGGLDPRVHQSRMSLYRWIAGSTGTKTRFALLPGNDDFPNSSRFGGELLALFDRLFDGADHVEGLLGQVVVFAFAQSAKKLDGVGEVDELEGRAGKDYGKEERLRQ